MARNRIKGVLRTDYGEGIAFQVDKALSRKPQHIVLESVTVDGRSVPTQPVIVPQPNRVPLAFYVVDVTDLTCVFRDQSSDPDGTVASWSWDFGDGTTSTESSPSYTYPQAGTYSVTLKVTDNNGAESTFTTAVSVAPPPPPPNTQPTAQFDVSVADLQASFVDRSIDGDGTIVQWSWDFGDGAVSSEASPTHTYADTGSFTVSLTVTDDKGATAVATSTVSVTAAPPPPPPPTNTDITIVGGNNQTGTVSVKLPSPLAIEVKDSTGAPAANTEVVWRPTSGGGRMSNASLYTHSPDASSRAGKTDANGRATADWHLGSVEGLQEAEAVVTNIGTVVFTATATSGATPPPPPPPTTQLPDAPVNVAATATVPDRATVSWSPGVVPGNSYEVEVATGTVPFGFVGTTTGLSLVDTGLTPLTGYTYRVRAVNANGVSGYSATASVTTPAVQPPPPPSTGGITGVWQTDLANQTLGDFRTAGNSDPVVSGNGDVDARIIHPTYGNVVRVRFNRPSFTDLATAQQWSPDTNRAFQVVWPLPGFNYGNYLEFEGEFLIEDQPTWDPKTRYGQRKLIYMKRNKNVGGLVVAAEGTKLVAHYTQLGPLKADGTYGAPIPWRSANGVVRFDEMNPLKLQFQMNSAVDVADGWIRLELFGVERFYKTGLMTGTTIVPDRNAPYRIFDTGQQMQSNPVDYLLGYNENRYWRNCKLTVR